MKSIKKILAVLWVVLLGLTACKKDEVPVQPRPVQIVYTPLKNWSAHASLIKKIEVNLPPADSDKIAKAVGSIKVTLLFQDNKTIALPAVVKTGEDNDFLTTYFYKLEESKIILYRQLNKDNVIIIGPPPKELRLNFFVVQ